MSNPRLLYDHEGIDSRTEQALDGLVAALQVWFDAGAIDFDSYITGEQPKCRYFLASAQSIANDTDTAVEWSAVGQEFVWSETELPSVHYDNGAKFGQKFLVANGEWLTPPIAGHYLVTAGVAFASNATGRRDIWLEQRANQSAQLALPG